MLLAKIAAVFLGLSFMSLSHAGNIISFTKLQTKGLLGGCLSGVLIDESAEQGELMVLSSETEINPLFKYYCVTGQIIPLPKDLPCSRYAKTAFKILTSKEIASASASCD